VQLIKTALLGLRSFPHLQFLLFYCFKQLKQHDPLSLPAAHPGMCIYAAVFDYILSVVPLVWCALPKRRMPTLMSHHSTLQYYSPGWCAVVSLCFGSKALWQTLTIHVAHPSRVKPCRSWLTQLREARAARTN